MLHKLILQNGRFNFCSDKNSFKYSETFRYRIPIYIGAQANYTDHHALYCKSFVS